MRYFLPPKENNNEVEDEIGGPNNDTGDEYPNATLLNLDIQADSETIIDNKNIAITPEQDEEHTDLARTWVLAEKLKVPELQNAVLDKFTEISKVDDSYSPVIFRYVYKNTYHGSQLRQYLLSTCLSGIAAYEYRRDHLDFPHDMLVDLLVERTKWSSPSQKQMMERAERPVSDFYVSTITE